MEKIVRVKLFGEALKLHKLKIDVGLMPILIQVANKIKLPLLEALTDIEFFRVLNMKEFQSLNDLTSSTFSGLINNYRNQVEITYGRKRIAKFNIDTLLYPTTLFPLYNTQVNFINTRNLSTGIYVEEREIGLIGTYEIAVGNFQIDVLQFYLTKINYSSVPYELLNAITYNNQKLICLKSDTLLNRQIAFSIG
ncbi:hypothetical protein [Lutibacter sp.]|uniref:hypothetical protein n=1 Tax=Lutibacter sp. TaxID=1925666 RepID=UPI001A25F0AC|nr:hypothetical protein [Lutibacter sp.]MBI9041954.1 hypothetical protein [Lutibacter sp.]